MHLIPIQDFFTKYAHNKKKEIFDCQLMVRETFKVGKGYLKVQGEQRVPKGPKFKRVPKYLRLAKGNL